MKNKIFKFKLFCESKDIDICQEISDVYYNEELYNLNKDIKLTEQEVYIVLNSVKKIDSTVELSSTRILPLYMFHIMAGDFIVNFFKVDDERLIIAVGIDVYNNDIDEYEHYTHYFRIDMLEVEKGIDIMFKNLTSKGYLF